MNNELQLVESKETREQYIERVDVLEKVKGLVLLSDNIHVTTEMVASYYEVDIETLKSLLKYNHEEIESDGYRVLKGAELKKFKGEVELQPNLKYASSLAIIPKRAILRIGMLLRDSKVAKEIRTYLLNVEEKSPVEFKFDALESMGLEIGNIKTDILDINNTLKEYVPYLQLIPQTLLMLEQSNTHIVDLKQCLAEFNMEMIETRKMMSDLYSLLNIPENDRQAFDKLVARFGEKMGIRETLKRFSDLYKALSNWFNIEILKDPCKRDYIIRNRGISLIAEFINGVALNRIVKNKHGNWVDLGGYKCNSVEFNRTIVEFDYCCAYCGRTGVELYPEHIIPQSNKDTTNKIHNIVPTCGDCNKSKLNKDAKKWYEEQLFYTIKRANTMNEHWAKYSIK